MAPRRLQQRPLSLRRRLLSWRQVRGGRQRLPPGRQKLPARLQPSRRQGRAQQTVQPSSLEQKRSRPRLLVRQCWLGPNVAWQVMLLPTSQAFVTDASILVQTLILLCLVLCYLCIVRTSPHGMSIDMRLASNLCQGGCGQLTLRSAGRCSSQACRSCGSTCFSTSGQPSCSRSKACTKCGKACTKSSKACTTCSKACIRSSEACTKCSKACSGSSKTCSKACSRGSKAQCWHCRQGWPSHEHCAAASHSQFEAESDPFGFRL